MTKPYFKPLVLATTLAIFALVVLVQPHQVLGATDTASTSQAQADRQKADEEAMKKDIENLDQNRLGDGDTNRNPYQIVDDEECKLEADKKKYPPGSGGPFVPVHEVGELLSLSRSINAETINNRQLDEELCRNIKSIRRIELSFEYQKAVEEPALRRQAMTSNAQDTQGIYQLVKTGYKSSPQSPAQGDSSLVVKNLATHVNELRTEQAEILKDDINNQPDNPYKQSNLEAVQNAENAKSADDLTPTITQQEVDSLTSADTDPQTFWQNFLKATQIIQNTPSGSFLSTINELARRQDRAEQYAREKIIAAQGVLPVRHCTETTKDGKTCRHWEDDTPGIIISLSLHDAVASRLNQYINSPDAGVVGTDNGPTVAEITTLTPGGSGDSGIVPGGGGGRNGNSGDNGIPCIIPGIFPPGCGSKKGGGGGGGGGGDQTPTDPPSISAHFTTPTLAQVNSGTPNISKLFWDVSGRGNITCTADNVWLTGSTTPGFNEIIYNQGDALPKNEDAGLAIRHPLAFTLNASHNNNPATADLNSFYDGNLLSQFGLYVPGGNGVAINQDDTFGLTFTKNDGSTEAITIGGVGQVIPASAAKVVSLFKTAIETALAGGDPELQKYQFDYTIGDLTSTSGIGLLNISTNPIYKIKCQNEAGTAQKAITIGR